MQRSDLDTDDDIGHWGHPPHTHQDGQLVTAIVGSGSLRIDGHEHAFDATTGIWVPAGVLHSGRFEADLVPLAVDLPFPGMPTQAKNVAIDSELRAVLLAWARESDDDRNVERERRLADAVVTSPTVRVPLRVPTGVLTGPVVEHLRRAPADVPPLPHWAGVLHVSVATVRRAFLAETGLTYSEWTTLFRLDMSIPRLRAGEPVAAVARATGFSANGYTLAFRRWTGLSPSEFRARATS